MLRDDDGEEGLFGVSGARSGKRRCILERGGQGDQDTRNDEGKSLSNKVEEGGDDATYFG